MTLDVPRPFPSLDPLITEAKRRAKRRRRLLGVVAVLIVGGAGFAVHSWTASGRAGNSVAAANCGKGEGISGPGFHVFACMSGGVLAGHPHPKELLVVRSDGSSVAYPAFRVGEFAVGDGEVVAAYDVDLVRVTGGRLVPLVTTAGLGRALHVRPAAVMDIHHPRLDARGDVDFVASVPGSHGCENRTLERTAGGTIRQIRVSRNHACG